MKVYCVFTFQDYLLKIFKRKQDAEKFKSLYSVKGSIKEFDVCDDIIGTIIKNGEGNLMGKSCK